ncbi:MAG TPA: N(4)-(beta-N-acetylglucosaminyl)-L-asparaginase [Longimicrobiales bacterium]|nr:N(4)-(beta-N-acetylglucosaminyl)-L-asparaginase [Longimicrobiales bacterium]
MSSMNRRDFVRTGAVLGAAAAAAPGRLLAETSSRETSSPEAPMLNLRAPVRPVVISDLSGYEFRNGGPHNAVERAFKGITEGEDPLDALIAGVNIPELDPEETGIGYGGLPNAEGVVQLDSCCMHGPLKRAGGVAALEGVRTPSKVAKAVMDLTDHHLLVGKGAQDFAREVGFTIEDNLNTPRSRDLWLEWKRRLDPGHFPSPESRQRGNPAPPPWGEHDDGRSRPSGTADTRAAPASSAAGHAEALRVQRAYQAGLSMVRDGLIPDGSFWGTINCNGITPAGDICGVTTTSGLAWKISGRVGDSPILGAGLYVDNDVGAVGSTGRGEANLYNLTSFLVVEAMRRGASPRDAAMEGLRRIRRNTIEKRLLNDRGLPNFNVRLFVLNKKGEFAGVTMYAAGEAEYAVCTENGAEKRSLEPLLDGAP